MNFLSFVGNWLGSPTHSIKRFSKTLAVCIKGILKFMPGVVMALPTGLPNWVTTTCSYSRTVKLLVVRHSNTNKAATPIIICFLILVFFSVFLVQLHLQQRQYIGTVLVRNDDISQLS